MGKLDGKVALVTGSGRNIGRATVLKLAGEGAHVVVNARSNQAEADAVAREARDRGVKALAVIADVAKKDQVDAMVARALSEFGRVDILVNNAAIRPHKPFTEVTIEDWEHVRGVVLDGALYCTRAVIDSMVANRYGRILFFTGEGAFTGGVGAPTYRQQRWASSGWREPWRPSSRPRTSGPTWSPPAASTPDGTIPSGIRGGCRAPPEFRSAVKGRWTRSPPPASFWSTTMAASSPARPFTSTAARDTTDAAVAARSDRRSLTGWLKVLSALLQSWYWNCREALAGYFHDLAKIYSVLRQ
jgi:NADP-dependent 3-hydroxy acid dehydrogenase YdfG